MYRCVCKPHVILCSTEEGPYPKALGILEKFRVVKLVTIHALTESEVDLLLEEVDDCKKILVELPESSQVELLDTICFPTSQAQGGMAVAAADKGELHVLYCTTPLHVSHYTLVLLSMHLLVCIMLVVINSVFL